jgi:hypothetical protein
MIAASRAATLTAQPWCINISGMSAWSDSGLMWKEELRGNTIMSRNGLSMFKTTRFWRERERER